MNDSISSKPLESSQIFDTFVRLLTPYDGAAVVIQTAARAFLARKAAARKKALKEAAVRKEAAAAEVVYFPVSIHDVGPSSPEYTLAELLDAAFPDLEDMFSAEELLALWGEFEADKTA